MINTQPPYSLAGPLLLLGVRAAPMTAAAKQTQCYFYFLPFFVKVNILFGFFWLAKLVLM